MAKSKPIKWAVGADEPEDLQEFLSNDEIVDKHRDKKTEDISWIGKGPHRFVVRRLSSKPNKNGDARVNAMCVLANDDKASDKSWNGYVIFDGFNITEQGKPYLKRFLKSIGLTWSDFHSKAKGEEDDSSGRTNITQIAGVKFDGGKDVALRATVTMKPADDYNDDEHLEISRFLPAPGMDEESSSGDDSSDEAATSFGDDDSPSREDQEAAIMAELDGMELAALQKRAKRNDKKADIPAKKKKVIALIMEQEIPPF